MNNIPDPFDETEVSVEGYAAFPVLDTSAIDGGQIPASHTGQPIVLKDDEDDMPTLRMLMNQQPEPETGVSPASEDQFIDPFGGSSNGEGNQPEEPVFRGSTNDPFLAMKLIDPKVEIVAEDPELFHQVIVPIDEVTQDTLGRLEEIHAQLVEQGSISQLEVQSVESFAPGLINRPIGAFTKTPSLVNYQQSMESILSRIQEILVNGLERIMEMIRNFGNWIRSKFSSGVTDKLRRFDPADLRTNRDKLLAKAKALDSQHGVTIVKEIVDPSMQVNTRSSAYLYIFDWLNAVTHKGLEHRYTTGIRLIVENRTPSHVNDLKSLIDAELTNSKNYLEKLNSTDITIWDNVTTPTLPIRELNQLVGFWGAVGKNTTTFASYVEDYRNNVREAFKLETSHAPRDFQRASSYTTPYGDMSNFVSSIEGRIKDLERSADKLKKKITSTKNIPSNASGRFNLVTERITFIQNMMGVYKTIYSYYLTVYATINRPMVGMAIRLDAVYKKGKASELIKQHL